MRVLYLERAVGDPRRVRVLVVICVALAAIAVYISSLGNQFAYDDIYVIQDRGSVHELSRLPELITDSYWPGGFYDAGLYRPLTMATFAVDWAVWGGAPFGLHLTNVLLHAAACALVGLFLLLFFPWWAALAGGLVFAVHPIHTEAVASLVGRAEMLTTLFVLVAAMVYVKAGRSGGLTVGRVAVIAVCYFLASISKEVGVVLPGLLLATDLPLLARRQLGTPREYVRTRVTLFAVLTGILALVLALRWAVLGSAVDSTPHLTFSLDHSFTTRLFTMARIWPRYFELLAVPWDLSSDYSPATVLPVAGLTPLGAVGFLLVLSSLVIVVVSFRRAPEFAMAAGWAAIALLPVCNLIIAAEILLAERTLYIPSLAVSIVVALLLVRTPAPRKSWLVAGVALWVSVFSVVTVRRNPVWRDTWTLMEELRQKHPESARFLFYFADLTYQRSGWDQAEPHFRAWLRIWPHHAPWLVRYGVVLSEQGMYEEAQVMIRRAIQFRPRVWSYHQILAAIQMDGGDPESALRTLDELIAEAGDDPDFHAMRAMAYEAAGDYSAAARAQEMALAGWGEGVSWRAWSYLAQLRCESGDTVAALEALAVVRAKPGAQPEVADSLEQVCRGLSP
ncbi:MAG: tetratricopeptide repeat protein [Gemmatimonadota bacterium]|nr:MAG: tetratricopeptide repeat protein [Gemmatimonadota bacterium]